MKVTTSTLAGPKNTVVITAARAFIAGITERGPVTPLMVRSIVEYQILYGAVQSYSANMYRAAQMFFEEGGAELVVCREVGSTNTLASVTLVDRTPVTPLPTLKMEAANPGAWGGALTVSIEAGAVTDTVTFSAFYGGQRIAYIANAATVAAIVSNLAGNVYIRATDMAAISVGVTRLPALQSGTLLSGGNDDRATVTAASVVAALDLAGSAWGTGAVAAPGYTATQVGALLIAHSKTYRRVAILAGAVTSTASDLTAMAAALSTDGEYAGVFGPWLTVPDGSSSVSTPPEGFVLGVRARTMAVEGFWQPPAGGRSAARFVRGPVDSYDSTVIDTLADGHVSGVTSIGGETLLYGWRSCSTNVDQYQLLNGRDSVNTVTSIIEQVLQPYVFETIDGTGQLLARVTGALIGELQPIQDAGGFAPKVDATGKEINPGYKVTTAVLGETALSATVVFRLSGVAETIEVSIVKAAFNATI